MTALLSDIPSGSLCAMPRGYSVSHLSKFTKVSFALGARDVSDPFLALPIPVDANDPARVSCPDPAVLGVRRARNVAEIAYPIVRFVAVYVVNLPGRPHAIVDCPRDPMAGHHKAADRRHFVTPLSGLLERWLASKPSVPGHPMTFHTGCLEQLRRPWPPVKIPRLRLVSEQLATQFWRDIGSFSHRWSFHLVVRAARSLVASARPAFYSRITICSQVEQHWICRGRLAAVPDGGDPDESAS